MKKYTILLFAALSTILTAHAQDDEKLTYKVGGRVGIDAAYYSSDDVELNSGAKLTDTRINTSLAYGQNWYMFAEVDFATAAVKLKNVYIRYTNNNHSVKFGYFNEAASMSFNTSSYSYHFITRANSANTLQSGRALGATYKYVDNKWFANQGLAFENVYNNQDAGSQGGSVSSRWLYKPINNSTTTLHLGVNARYANCNTGEYNDDGLFYQYSSISSPIDSSVDKISLLSTGTIDWVSSELTLGVEALAKGTKYFARGEYMYKRLGKSRDDQAVFETQTTYTTLTDWLAANPLEANSFHGGYIEAGYLLIGNSYAYDNSNGVLKGNSKGSLELVARYNYTNLDYTADNEINNITGGVLNSCTLGVNYSVNKFIQVLVDYTYTNVNKSTLDDKYAIHTLQTRVVASF